MATACELIEVAVETAWCVGGAVARRTVWSEVKSLIANRTRLWGARERLLLEDLCEVRLPTGLWAARKGLPWEKLWAATKGLWSQRLWLPRAARKGLW